MKKNIFAVCDLEVDYALNFMDYLNHKKNIPFEIQAFTNVESLIAYGKMNHIELLLISQKAMCRHPMRAIICLPFSLCSGVKREVSDFCMLSPERITSSTDMGNFRSIVLY